MATQSAEFHNSDARASGKVRRNRFVMSEAKAAACRLAKSLCLPLTFRNLYVIELAIEAEVAFSSASIQKATDDILEGAQTARRQGELVNYLWFEDSGWRFAKLSFRDRDDLRMREKARWY